MCLDVDIWIVILIREKCGFDSGARLVLHCAHMTFVC